MAQRLIMASLGVLILGALSTAEADPLTTTKAYLDGALISIKIRPIPEGAAASLVSRDAELGDFFDGAIWLCAASQDSNEFACFLEHTTPVLKSAPKNSLLQAHEIFWMPGRTPRDLKAWDQIEEAVAFGDIILTEEQAVYRINSQRGSEEASVEGKAATETVTWGRVKSTFR